MKRKQRKIKYLSISEMIEFNILVLSLIKTKKADKSEVLSYKKIMDIEEGCKKIKGDIYDKATYLLKSVIQKHAFASGNRRTAFIITKRFLLSNGSEFNIDDSPEYARIMTGIRENFYNDSEIKNWIKHGKIKEFTRG